MEASQNHRISDGSQRSYGTVESSSENTCGSPVSGSCVTDNDSELMHMLRELETAMLGSDCENPENAIHVQSGTQASSLESEKWKYMVEVVSRGDLKELLCLCTKAIEENDIVTADWLVSQTRPLVSVSGEPIQRLGAYLLEGLIARLAVFTQPKQPPEFH